MRKILPGCGNLGALPNPPYSLSYEDESSKTQALMHSGLGGHFPDSEKALRLIDWVSISRILLPCSITFSLLTRHYNLLKISQIIHNK